jgi:hypothetical protein
MSTSTRTIPSVALTDPVPAKPTGPTHRPTRRRRRRSALLVAGAFALTGSLVASATPAGSLTASATPGGGQTYPFVTPPASIQSAPGVEPMVLVVGDSLTFRAALSGNGLADAVKVITGRATVVSAAYGATWKTFYDPAQTAGTPTVPEYTSLRALDNKPKPSVVVTALGSNDAAILADQQPAYTPEIIRTTVMDGLREQMKWTKCSLLVNTYTNSGDKEFPPAETNFINIGMIRVMLDLNVELGANRVFIADWNAFAAPFHSSFYPGGNIHHTSTGEAWYQWFIASKTNELLALPQCK